MCQQRNPYSVMVKNIIISAIIINIFDIILPKSAKCFPCQNDNISKMFFNNYYTTFHGEIQIPTEVSSGYIEGGLETSNRI